MLTFDASDHTYRHKGVIVPSVSELMRPLTADKMAAIPAGVLAAAADRGTRVHKLCELYDLGQHDPFSDDAIDYEGYLAAWVKFCTEHDAKWTAIEHPVFHEAHRYAGTPDRFGYVDGAYSCVDIKATFAMPATVGVQTTAYDMARLSATEGLDRARLVAVRLKRDGSYEMRDFEREEFTVLSLINVHNWRQRNG